MSHYETDAEQIEQVKELWQKYGFPMVSGVIIASLLMFGWRQWQNYRTHVSEQASMLYQMLLRDPSQPANVRYYVKELTTNFKFTPYAAAAELVAAKQAVNNHKIDEAKSALAWILANRKPDSVRQVARLRLARLEIAEQHLDEAKKLLATVDDIGFASEINEVLGDIALAQHQEKDALVDYQQAWKTLPQGADNILLMMKIQNLGGKINNTLPTTPAAVVSS